eukprot:XP_017948222.1 PREDICTED: olfactory receptor 6C4-like [Xenopus tropicalis]
MDNDMNTTSNNGIFLRGFGNLHDFKIPFFFLFFAIYMLTLTSNLLIIILVSTHYHLQSPMFFFLAHLSFSDLLVTTNILPNMLLITLTDGGMVFLSGCLTQFFFYGLSATTECLLLSAMSYDRYLAICKPLHYHTVMDSKLCSSLVISSWSLSFILTIIPIYFLQRLRFCGINVIDHFFCDLGPLLELSCSDTSFVKLEVFAMSTLLTMVPFVFICVTYVYIILSILRISTNTGRQKAFSTCSSHLAVVCAFYGALFAMYVAPSKGDSAINKGVSLLYTVVTPLFNPIIYSLRNQDIRTTIRKYLRTQKPHI